MGYTHYFKMPGSASCSDEAWKRLLRDTERIEKYCHDRDVVLFRDFTNLDKPQIGPYVIAFNGGDKGHETFVLSPHPQSSDTLCKTSRKPYDLAVTSVLMRLHHHYPDADINSDGDADDWQPAQDLCRELFGNDTLPPNIRGQYDDDGSFLTRAIVKAKEMYALQTGDREIAIDETVDDSPDDGVWVSARVWVPKSVIEE